MEKDAATGSQAKDQARERPVFVPKTARHTISEREAEQARQAALYDEEQARRDRHVVARTLVADYLHRDAATEEQRKKAELAADNNPLSLDDTDGLDPEMELQEWRLRELQRLKRDKEEGERFEREHAELAQTRALSEADRRRIDAEKLAEWEAKPRQEYRFMQKYYHAGAFYQDSGEPVLHRDASAPTLGDRANKELLPESMQVRDYGKRSRSKWTHLTAEDTTAFDYGWGSKDNPVNYSTVSKMSGMRGDLEHPSKRRERKQ